jgi:hypothetical protein
LAAPVHGVESYGPWVADALIELLDLPLPSWGS